MPALLFPSLDTLRLVLASGILPTEITDAPARAGFDDRGRIRLEPAVLPTREMIAGLGRLSVRFVSESGPLGAKASCWAELLPLREVRNSIRTSPERVLFQLPDAAVARFVAGIRRQGSCALSLSFLADGRTWLLVERPPHAILLRSLERDSGIEAFAAQAPNVWVQLGWEHPVPVRLIVPPSQTLLLRSARANEFLPLRPQQPRHEEYCFAPREVVPISTATVNPIPIPLRLVRAPQAARETLWVYSGSEIAAFWKFCRSADERLIRRFQVAVLENEAEKRIVVRTTPGKKVPPFLASPARGYVPDGRFDRLFFPHGWSLHPNLRFNQLVQLFQLTTHRLTWIESDGSGVVNPQHVSVSAFRPVSECLEYQSSVKEQLSLCAMSAEVFPLQRFALRDELAPADQLETHPMNRVIAGREAETPAAGVGWWARSLEMLAERFRRSREVSADGEAQPQARKTAPRRAKPIEQVKQELSSAHALLLGHDRTTRRQALEAELLADFPSLTPELRAARWSELAGVYGSTGNPMDAAVCWMNAVWELEPASAAWQEQWLLAECRAAKLNERKLTLDRVLSEPGRFGMGRVLAAYVVWSASQNLPTVEFSESLPRILAFLDHQFDDLPARAAWLARHALARMSRGDCLGLARWRDRVLERLRERGPGLDLDEPSFLRFHGTTSPDRFQTAREWLTKSRGFILSWVAKLGNAGRLQWAGLDAETDCTGAYAQLLLAWGLGHLGERTRSRDWTARARKVLTRAGGIGVDSAVHAFLADLFVHRIRDAQEGRTAKPGLPSELDARYERLTGFSRYAVDKLRRFVRILEPIDRVHDYRGHEFRSFWGQDPLGERLSILMERTNPAYRSDEARQLLADCAANPTSENVPRITFTLLESIATLDAALVPQVLGQVVPALEWLETWIQSSRRSVVEQEAALHRFQSRLLDTVFAAATRSNELPAVRPLVEYLIRHVAGDPVLRQSLARVSTTVFRSLRKLGYRAESEQLLNLLDPARGQRSSDSRFSSSRLGIAVGWFAIGDEESGNRILNEARDHLFLAGTDDDRDRTELAIAYATTLGFAPPRIALGRLEEIFQRLERVTLTGSTNRYFTLKPLELIDAVVRAVVTEDFALGPAVRGWMDDDEFLIRQRIHRDMADVMRSEECPAN